MNVREETKTERHKVKVRARQEKPTVQMVYCRMVA